LSIRSLRGILILVIIFLWNEFIAHKDNKQKYTEYHPYEFHGGSYKPPSKNDLPERPILAATFLATEFFYISLAGMHTFVG
tara:strand:- start:326 stop:568 length:243 start_codon:yes stop_codon:yes gene_type:complete